MTAMDVKGCTLAAILIINCICMAFSSPSSVDIDSVSEYGSEMGGYGSLRGPLLERKLREDIEREIADVQQLEHQLMGHLNLIHEKKRQLEIKKRQPVQCLVNIVSCWKRK